MIKTICVFKILNLPIWLKTPQFDRIIWVNLPGNSLFLKTLESSILSVQGDLPTFSSIANLKYIAENSTILQNNLGRPTRKWAIFEDFRKLYLECVCQQVPGDIITLLYDRAVERSKDPEG